MKAPKAPSVPVLENAFEVNLSMLMRAAKATGSSRLVLDDGDVRTGAVLAETRLAVFFGGRQWLVDIVPVRCLQSRGRPSSSALAHTRGISSLCTIEAKLSRVDIVTRCAIRLPWLQPHQGGQGSSV